MKNFAFLFLLAIVSQTLFSQNYLRKILVVPNNTSAFNTVLNDYAVVLDSASGMLYQLPTGSDDRDNTLDSIADKRVITGDTTSLSYRIDEVVHTDTIVLDSSELLHLNSSPVSVISAPGSGYANIIINAIVDYDYVTAEYTGDTALVLYYDTQDSAIFKANFAIDGSTDRITPFIQSATGIIVSNKAIKIKSPTADASGATALGTATIYVTYRKIKIY